MGGLRGKRRVDGDEEPPWARSHGTRRVVKEYNHLASEIHRGVSGVYGLSLPDDNDVSRWHVKMKDFDADSPGGQQLNCDLAELHRRYDVEGCLTLEILFPSEYPAAPPFIRVVTPRCVWYTGHVTAGGSVCVEALTQTGSPRAWRSQFAVAAILETVKVTMIHVEPVIIRTANGPGGIAGPLRVDLDRRYNFCDPTVPYSLCQAKSAFARSLAHHAANGW